MKKIIFALAIVICMVSVAFAEVNWTGYYMSDDNVYSIDAASVKTVKNERNAWVNWSFGKPHEYNGISTMKIKMVANCNKKTLRSVEALAYNANGDLLVKEKHYNALVLDPDTANTATYDYICK